MNLLVSPLLALLMTSGWPGLRVARPRGMAPAIILTFTATPATVMFSAADPDSGPDAGTAATVTVSALAGLSTSTWSLSVQAASSTFSGCATVPVSAVTVTCTGTQAAGLFGTGVCSAPFALSTSPHVIASGAEGTLAGIYAANITYTFTDSWKYVAQTCTLTVTYTANTP